MQIYTSADLNQCGFTPARIYKPRGKTPARNYKPHGFTPTAKKHLRGKTTTADLQATRIYTYRGKTPARFSSMTKNECLCVCFHLEATVLVQMGSKGVQKMQNHTEQVPKPLKISDSDTTKKYFWGGIF